MFIEKKRGAFLDKLMHSEEPLRKRFNFGYKYLKFLKIGFKKMLQSCYTKILEIYEFDRKILEASKYPNLKLQLILANSLSDTSKLPALHSVFQRLQN